MLTHYNIIFNFNGIDIFIFLLKNYIKVEAFWPPLQSVFAKDTAFLSAKAQNSRIRLCRILGQYAGILWRNLVFAFGKQRKLRF